MTEWLEVKDVINSATYYEIILQEKNQLGYKKLLLIKQIRNNLFIEVSGIREIKLHCLTALVL